jgi:hypothetical protein
MPTSPSSKVFLRLGLGGFSLCLLGMTETVWNTDRFLTDEGEASG